MAPLMSRQSCRRSLGSPYSHLLSCFNVASLVWGLVVVVVVINLLARCLDSITFLTGPTPVNPYTAPLPQSLTDSELEASNLTAQRQAIWRFSFPTCTGTSMGLTAPPTKSNTHLT